MRLDWKHAAEALGRRVPVEAFHPRVLRWVQDERRRRGPWAVAFSGGADSLCLLLLLWAHWPERRERLLVLHFNHRLRGRESGADAVFCARVCRALGVRYEQGIWAARPRKVSEAEAREARHDFFSATMRTHRSSVLWTGHQRDDVAETLLMRIARGSGSSGLAAPRPVQVVAQGRTHLRPLLGLCKEEICELLRQEGVSWREDSSNSGGAFLRNRVRAEVLPVWSRTVDGRDALAGAAMTRELLEEDDEALQTWLQELNPFDDAGSLLLAPLAQKPRGLVRRALHRWLATTPYRGDLSKKGFEVLLLACEAGKSTRFSLGREGFALIRKGVLRYQES